MFRALFLYALIACLAALAGCGGGGTGGSRATLARQRAVASTRVMRQTMAIAGLGRHITRAPGAAGRTGRRASLIMSAIAARRFSRAPVLGFDEDAKLYYALNVSPDGSGREELFVDEAREKSAGFFSWGVPSWKNGVPDQYPAVLHVTFSITAGEFAGVHGSMDLTVNDPSFAKGVIHVVLTNVQNERADADFDCTDDMFSGTNDVTWPDGTSYEEKDEPDPSGGMICTITYSDGSIETLTMDPNGNGTTEIVDSQGATEAEGDYNGATGVEQIDYSDGSEETVDVDTGQDVPDNSSSDGLRVLRPGRLAKLRPASRNLRQ